MSNTIDLNPQEFPEGFPLFHTFNSLVDGTITHDDFLELNDKIKNDPAVTLQYLMFMQVVGELSFNQINDDSSSIDDDTRKFLTFLDDYNYEHKTPRSHKSLITVICCLVIFCTLSLGMVLREFLSISPQVCTIAPLEQVQFDQTRSKFWGLFTWKITELTNGISKGHELDRIDLKEGILKIKFSGGALVNIAAPASFEFRKGQCLFLHSGKIIVDADKELRTVSIGTPHGWIRHIGTEFCVRVTDDTGCEIQVLQGRVVVSPTPEGTLQSEGVCILEAKEAGIIKRKSDLLQRITYGPSKFDDLLSSFSGVVECSPNVKIIKEPFAMNFRSGGTESNNYLFLVCEKQNVKPDDDFTFTELSAGNWHLLTESKGFSTANTSMANSRSFDSFMFHRDLVGSPLVPKVNDQQNSEFDMIVKCTFDRPIVGFIENGKQLQATDQLFGAPACGYPHPQIDNINVRDMGEQTRVFISEDRKTLRMELPALVQESSDGRKRQVDQLRILVEPKGK